MVSHRPEKPIDWILLDKLILRQNTKDEIAGQFDMHHDTLARRIQDKYGVTFTAYAASIYSKGKGTLRSRQWDKAMEGNVQLLIKLGECYLDDQKPKKEDAAPVPEVILEQNKKLMDKLTEIQSSDRKIDDNSNINDK